MILGVVGSTDLTLPQRKTAHLVIRGVIVLLDDVQVISGGAYGIDQIAEGVAINLGRWKRKYLPRFNRWEPEGFKDRNILIAENCDMLLSVRSSQSKTYGSGWTADFAESIGKEVHRILLP